jgi:squid-like protein
MADSGMDTGDNAPVDNAPVDNAPVENASVDTAPVVAAVNAADEDDRKLFVGGLPQEVTEEEIKEYFDKFGEVDGVNLKTDPNTGRSRGFCFVVFKTVEDVDKVVAVPEEDHVLKGKKVAVKKAQAKQGKVYVGKIKPEVTDEEIKEFFAQYGAVASIEQPFDKMKNERKNFCFVTFEKEEPAKRLLKEGTVTIGTHELEIKKVTPKPDGMRGGRGGGGGRGGYGGYGGGGGYPQMGWGDQGWGGGYAGFDPYYGGGGGGGGGMAGSWGGYGGYGQQQGGQQWAGNAQGGGGRGRGAPRGRRGRPQPY